MAPCPPRGCPPDVWLLLLDGTSALHQHCSCYLETKAFSARLSVLYDYSVFSETRRWPESERQQATELCVCVRWASWSSCNLASRASGPRHAHLGVWVLIQQPPSMHDHYYDSDPFLCLLPARQSRTKLKPVLSAVAAVSAAERLGFVCLLCS